MTRVRTLAAAGIAAVALSGSLAARARNVAATKAVCESGVPKNVSNRGPTTATPISGTVFASHGRSGKASILDLASGAITTLSSGLSDAHEVVVSPDGRWGVAAEFGEQSSTYDFEGHRLSVVDLRTKRVAKTIDLGEHRGAHDVHFLAGSSSRLAVTTQTTREVVEVDIEAGTVIGATPTNGTGSHTLAVAADGRTAFTTNEPEGSVSHIDLGSRTFVRKFTLGTPPAEGIAVTPDGRDVWVAFRGEDVVRVVSAATGTVVATLPGFVSTERLAMTPDGKRVVIADPGCKDVKVADVATRRVLGRIGDLPEAGLIDVLPDNRTAIVPVDRGEIAVVDIEERRVVARHRLGRGIDGAGWGPSR